MPVTINGPMPRDVLKELLEAEFPDWKVVTSQRALDVIDRPTILLKQDVIVPLPAAPQSHFNVSFYVTIADPHQDMDLAEAALDQNVLALWAVLLGAPQTMPKQAKKVLFEGRYMAYDIETDLTVQKGQ